MPKLLISHKLKVYDKRMTFNRPKHLTGEPVKETLKKAF